MIISPIPIWELPDDVEYIVGYSSQYKSWYFLKRVLKGGWENAFGQPSTRPHHPSHAFIGTIASPRASWELNSPTWKKWCDAADRANPAYIYTPRPLECP